MAISKRTEKSLLALQEAVKNGALLSVTTKVTLRTGNISLTLRAAHPAGDKLATITTGQVIGKRYKAKKKKK